MANQWYETRALCWIDPDDSTGTVTAPVHGEDGNLVVLLEAEGWQDDPSCVNAAGWVYVRRPYVHPNASVEDRFKVLWEAELKVLNDNSIACGQDIEKLETRAQHQADMLDTVLDRLSAPAVPPHPQGVDKTEPLADIVDYEAAGAPWTLTIEGGRRR